MSSNRQIILIYAKELPLKQAVERAIRECIERGVFEEFLRRNRVEVLKMSIYEYDEEKHMQQERRDTIGHPAGRPTDIRAYQSLKLFACAEESNGQYRQSINGSGISEKAVKRVWINRVIRNFEVANSVNSKKMCILHLL